VVAEDVFVGECSAGEVFVGDVSELCVAIPSLSQLSWKILRVF